jgi:endonuclease/exonuclease/phosphatase family metal-dependent hydrolase
MNINCLTYNTSWATQANILAGSESNFVEACQKQYKKGGKQCSSNSLKKIKKLDKLDLVCLQEVNSDIEVKLMKSQTHLKKFKRGTVGLSSVSTLWNPEIFDSLVYNGVFNVSNKSDDRPCLVLIFKKNNEYIIVINVHMPWDNKHKQAFNKLRNQLFKNEKIKKFINENTKIIMMGDFNDSNTTIHKNSPLTIKYRNKSLKLYHKKTKSQARKTLKSCCWHKPKHKYKYFSDTGDYILVNDNVKQQTIFIPEIFRKSGRLNRLYSDHMPVMSKLKI